MARRNGHAEAVGRYASLGFLPNGCQTWDEFCSTMRRKEETLFAFSLMEKPPKENERTIYLGRPMDRIVFGILTDRKDGKIGRDCFYAGQVHGRAIRYGVISCDGFDEKNLQLEPAPTVENILSRTHSEKHCRISKVHTDGMEVMGMLEIFLYHHIGPDLKDIAGDDTTSDEKMKYLEDLIVMDKLFRHVFPKGGPIVLSLEASKWLGTLRERVVDQLEAFKGELAEKEAGLEKMKAFLNGLL